MNRLLPVVTLVPLLFWGSGCDELNPPDPPKPPQLPKVDLPLPKSAEGAWELIKVAGSKIEIDPTLEDPLTALGRCADLITGCYEDGQSLDHCVTTAPVCRTNEPWREGEACCPGACADAYQAARAGAQPLAAFERVFFDDASCFPGVTALLGGAP